MSEKKMKIRIKTLEELGGKIPGDWVEEMTTLCGMVYDVEPTSKNFYWIGPWNVQTEDVVALNEEIEMGIPIVMDYSNINENKQRQIEMKNIGKAYCHCFGDYGRNQNCDHCPDWRECKIEEEKDTESIERTLELRAINDLHVAYREVELPVIFGDVSIYKKTLEKLFGGFPNEIKISIKGE